jgi:hypothetical protein
MGRIYFAVIAITLLIFNNVAYATGFKIDLRENNPTLQKQLDKFDVAFDLDKNTVQWTMKVAKKYRRTVIDFKEQTREFNITSINNEGITMEESYRNFLNFQHRLNPDDDWLIGSKFYNKRYKKLVEESGGLDKPSLRIKLNLDTMDFEETLNPLTKKAKTYKESFAYDPEAIRKQENTAKFIQAAVFVATIYLIINHLDEINKIQETQTTQSTNTLTSNIPNNSPYKPVTTMDSWKWGQSGYWTGPITGHKAKEFVVMRKALLRRYSVIGF